jgi:hypothetical protein
VIPFGLTPMWFCIALFILIGAMFVVHWIMRRWTSWRKEIAIWIKAKQLEEEAGHGLERVYRSTSIPDFYRDRATGDLESLGLGTRAVLGRRNDAL